VNWMFFLLAGAAVWNWIDGRGSIFTGDSHIS
jgi:hypothetical protein